MPKHRTCGHSPKNAIVGIIEATFLGKADVSSWRKQAGSLQGVTPFQQSVCVQGQLSPATKKCLKRVHSLHFTSLIHWNCSSHPQFTFMVGLDDLKDFFQPKQFSETWMLLLSSDSPGTLVQDSNQCTGGPQSSVWVPQDDGA